MPGRRHPRLVVEDPPEVVAVGEDLGLERQERAARIDEVDARQPVLERDLLGAQVLLDGHRVVGAALDRRVVGDDDAGRALDPADAGDDPGARRVVVVQAGRGERAQLQEGRARVEQALDPLADGQLAALAVALDRAVVAAGAAVRDRPPGARAGRRRGPPSRRGWRAPRRPRGRAGCAGRPWRDDRPHGRGTGRRARASRGHAEPCPNPGRRALLVAVGAVAGCGGAPPSSTATAAGPLMTVVLTGGLCAPRRRATRRSSSNVTGGSTRRRSPRTISGRCHRRRSRRSTMRSGRRTSPRSGRIRSRDNARPPTTGRRSPSSSPRRRRPADRDLRGGRRLGRAAVRGGLDGARTVRPAADDLTGLTGWTAT